MTDIYHIPVMLNECIDLLNINPQGTYVDVTFGGGGHSKAIIEKLDGGKLYSFDQDADAVNNIPNNNKLIFIRGNFKYMRNYLMLHGVDKVDGILADLGVSSHHFDDQTRGFSFRFPEAELGMRMNNEMSLTAAHVINKYADNDLKRIFALYGEIEKPGKLASIISNERKNAEITTVYQLIKCVEPVTPKHEAKQFLAKLFQALRIEVNKEMSALTRFLEQTPQTLKNGGRLVIMSYHSLEDRQVKNFMRSGNVEGKQQKDFYGKIITPFKLINKKAVSPNENEINLNGRARSAKLRAAERVE